MISSTRTLTFFLLAGGLASAQNFYQEPQLFSTAPDPAKSVNMIERFGPVGLSIELHQPDFIMLTGAIEPGSPAETGGLKKGQIIESINGEILKDIDPRIQLGNIIEKSEASDGVLKFSVKGEAQPIVVKIPVLGAYSKTWPLSCPKSDKIVRDYADYLAKPGSSKGFSDAGMLFLLSTGEDKDLTPVRDWVHGLSKENPSQSAWYLGFSGIPLCEYYLRTGDPEALPIIQKRVQAAAKGEYLDAWAGRGGVTKLGYGQGHLNAGGTSVVTFLLLAKQCGADVDDDFLLRVLVHFYRYAGKGINPYGDDRPENSFVDNGKNGNLAFAMAAAASLTPDGENSVYAKARDIAAMSSFYTTTFMLHGHTGGGIGEIWRSGAMGLMVEKKPLQYREFMDNRKWHYDMSRRFDGTFGILGGAGYDTTEWGACYTWAYTFPRKTLRITGAPPSKFSKIYQLPAHPWGTAADEVFLSMDPVAEKDGKRQNISGETLAKDSSKPLISRLNQKELSDDEIRRYVYHPEYLVRNMVVNNAAGLTCDYMFPKPGPRLRPDLLEEFARHADPRVRNAGIRAAIKAFDPEADWCKRLFDFSIERLKDENESWWVKDACLSLVGKSTPDMIAPQVDVLLPYLKHKEQWLQNGALMALAIVSTDERCYEKVLPPMAELIRGTPRQSTTGGPMNALRNILPTASPKVRDLALKVFGDTYQNYGEATTWAGGQDMTGHRKETLEVIASTLATVPGGYDVLYQLSKAQEPNNPLPHKEVFLSADVELFGPDLLKVMKPLIRDELIYQYIGQKRRMIFNDIANPKQGASVSNSIDDLVDLYHKIDVHEYDWKNFGPDLKNTEWDYFTFDPKETQKYDMSPWRYRPVTYPQGMENWFAMDFNASKAGWKKGLPPFGQYKGKLTDNSAKLTESADGKKRTDTVWHEAPRSLWEKEVLLMRGSFEFPPLKPGYLYRLRVDSGQGVGAGDGFKIYINGKPLVETKEGLGKRAGDTQRGGWITKEFAGEFGKGPVTIAATSFLRYGDRAIVIMPPVPQGIFSVWLEERKLPPLDESVLRKAATFVPLLTSEWQAAQGSGSDETSGDDGVFRFDGKFVANPKIEGMWKVLGQVAKIEDFNPKAKSTPGKTPFNEITFKNDGYTQNIRWIWSGETLMDLDQNFAQKITPKTIDGKDYLFIEAGGFSVKNPANWKSPLLVLAKP